MPNIPQDLSYTTDHEYVRLSPDGIAQIGITDFAQGELGDIVYVELPRVGTKFAARDVFGTVEAVKAVSELFCPIAGEVTAINERLDKEPALVNSDPYGEGWMLKVRAADPAARAGLISPAEYATHIGG
jgi:glycine cleavage system H protein